MGRITTAELTVQLVIPLFILSIFIPVYTLNHHHRELREILAPESGIPIVREDGDGITDSLDSVVIKAIDIPEQPVTYEGSQVWRVTITNDKSGYVSQLQETEDISTWMGNGSAVDILLRSDVIPRILRSLRDKNLDFHVIIPDVQQAIDQENPPLSPELVAEMEGRAGHRMEWTTYHRIEDIYGFLDYLAQTFPDVCSVMSIGTSVEGRPIKVIRISNGKSGRPAIWIDGGTHAREWITPASVTYIINHLVENSEKLEAEYYILPVVNPDGYEYTFKGDRLWRKNRNSVGKGSTCTGVDLNRNYGYRWGGLGTSKQPCREIFAGTGPFSEPETRAIRDFFETIDADFKAYLSFHSYGQFILYPWGYDRRVPPDYADLERVGQQMAAAMKTAGGAESVYTVGNSASTLYAAAGGSDDWAKAIQKIKYTYTIELRDKGRYGFILPARYIISTAKEALVAVSVIAKVVQTA